MSASAPAIKAAVDEASFDDEVLGQSHLIPIVVDFWATWCAPCRQLGPVLESAVEELAGAVLLRTVDVDANPRLAQSYGVRGIPAVKAFREGRVSKEFVGAQPAPAVRAFLKALLPTKADQLTRQGDSDSLREALALDPSHLEARRALSRLLISEGLWAEAKATAAQAPQDRLCDGLAAWAELAEQNSPARAEEAVLEQLSAGDLARAGELAVGAVQSAVGASRELLRRAALYCFEVLGPEHPSVVSGRAQLAAALY
jgi:putative thioredoxin